MDEMATKRAVITQFEARKPLVEQRLSALLACVDSYVTSARSGDIKKMLENGVFVIETLEKVAEAACGTGVK